MPRPRDPNPWNDIDAWLVMGAIILGIGMILSGWPMGIDIK